MLNIYLKEVVLCWYQNMLIKAGGVMDDWNAGVLKIIENTVSENHHSIAPTPQYSTIVSAQFTDINSNDDRSEICSS